VFRGFLFGRRSNVRSATLTLQHEPKKEGPPEFLPATLHDPAIVPTCCVSSAAFRTPDGGTLEPAWVTACGESAFLFLSCLSWALRSGPGELPTWRPSCSMRVRPWRQRNFILHWRVFAFLHLPARFSQTRPPGAGAVMWGPPHRGIENLLVGVPNTPRIRSLRSEPRIPVRPRSALAQI
jgi:hypothetical protein